MNGCIYRTEDGKCKKFSVGGVLSFCYLDGTCDCQISSNADRVRGMSDEELADYHTKMCGCPPGHDPIFCGMATIGCKGCWLSWLKAPVEVDDGT